MSSLLANPSAGVQAVIVGVAGLVMLLTLFKRSMSSLGKITFMPVLALVCWLIVANQDHSVSDWFRSWGS